MGFPAGFTGGVTLTLSIAYLTVLAHQRNRERQSAILRANNTVISGITDPLPPVHPPTRAEVAAIQRSNFVETAKDRWNAEVEGAVRWAQDKDWVEVREGAETAVSNAWAKAFGGAVDGAERGEQEASVVVKNARDQAAEKAQTIADRTRSVAGQTTSSVAEVAKSAYADAKTRGSEAVTRGEKQVEEVKGSIFNAVGKGIEKGKEALGLAREKLASGVEKIEGKADEKLSPVDRALKQRFEKPSGVNKSVDEILGERYLPVDKRDNTVLRAV